MAENPFSNRRVQDPSKPSTDLTDRWPVRNTPTMFDWTQVDGDLLRAALHVALVSGKTIGIGPAMGGRGVVVTLYMGLKSNPKRFAINGEELHVLLESIIDAWGSKSEDTLAMFRFTVSHDRAAD